MHVKSRPIHHLGTGLQQKVTKIFGAIERYFQISWLEKREGHPLQILWSRRDFLSTNQLILLGDALLTLEKTDSSWVKDQVKKIKLGPPNTRKGAAFEILGLSLLSSDDTFVRPARRDQPGYDGVLVLPNKQHIHVSIKNYGLSSFEGEFISYSQKLNKILSKKLQVETITGLSFYITASSYPNSSEWTNLTEYIENNTINSISKKSPVKINENWSLSINPPPKQMLPLHLYNTSYHLTITVPHHKNEAKNFIDKLDDAAANARKHASRVPTDAARCVLFRIPERITLKTCEVWAESYFMNNPHGPLDLVMLYQPSVGSTKEQTMLIHSISARASQSYIKYLERSPGGIIKIHPIVGVISSESVETKTVSGETILDITDMYMFQDGDYYTTCRVGENGIVDRYAEIIGPGIRQHLVVHELEPRPFVLTSRSPPDNTLSLYE